MRLGQSPENLELLRSLERSQRAATKLHQMVLDYEQSQAGFVGDRGTRLAEAAHGIRHRSLPPSAGEQGR